MAQPGPNPQTNLIISIVLPVVAVITVLALYFTKPVIVAPAAPVPVNTAAVALPPPGVQQANALPGAAAGAGGAGGGRGGPGNIPAKGGPIGAGGGGAPPPGVGMGSSVPGGRPSGAGAPGVSGG
jgi:hypothetical protein